MLLSFVPLLAIPFIFFTVVCGRLDWSINNGKTRLRGNSFGSGSVNTTYDYIVSCWEESLVTLRELIRLPCRLSEAVPLALQLLQGWQQHRM